MECWKKARATNYLKTLLIFPLYFFMITLSMKKVKSFIQTFTKSLFPHHVTYHHFLNVRFGSAFRYFISLVLVLNLGAFIFFIANLNPIKMSDLINNLTLSVGQYPSDLVINIRRGLLTTTYNQPYLAWLNYGGSRYLLLAVDESAIPNKIDSYQSYMLLTKNDFVFTLSHKPGDFMIIPLNNIGNITFDKSTAIDMQKNLLNVNSWFTIVYLAFCIGLIIVLPTISIIITLLYLVTGALIAYFLLRMANPQIHWKKVIQIGLFAVTLPLLIDYILLFIGLRTPYQPLMFFALTTLFTIGGTYEAYYPLTTHHSVHHKT